jgi:FkbM family methyltransferase
VRNWTRAVAAALRTSLRYGGPLVQASVATHVDVAGARLHVPGSLAIRLSIVAGNIRIHRLMDGALHPGATVVDVGAHIGYNTVYAAGRVGPTGRVVAVEPAPDNLQVLRENVVANGLANVDVKGLAAGRSHGTRDFFVRGEISAVNSFFPESVYGRVSDVTRVTVAPLDDLVDGHASLVKIDVEGGELEVLAGMPRLLRAPGVQLIVEWHPLLQQAAGYAADALPRLLLEHRFALQAASHTRIDPLAAGDLPRYVERLRRTGRPAELVARR